MQVSYGRRVVADAIGTCLLVATVVGSGIAGATLSHGNEALALLANTRATGAGLLALILAFGPVSGAHFNPAVTDAWRRWIPWREVPGYLVAQVAGAIGGAWITHLMFGLPVREISHHARGGAAVVGSELIATFGLVAVI